MNKFCPMNDNKNTCDASCALYISPDELNEVVLNKLASIGLIKRDEGICSYKHLALCMGRQIFDSSQGYRR